MNPLTDESIAKIINHYWLKHIEFKIPEEPPIFIGFITYYLAATIVMASDCVGFTFLA
ncbi:MAG: hypothetical protein CM1200mP16_07350 [Nitrospina sp.]|nr:MAG: hypothetical protein CM1200mP16_07350 [Nitrospina sp.]